MALGLGLLGLLALDLFWPRHYPSLPRQNHSEWGTLWQQIPSSSFNAPGLRVRMRLVQRLWFTQRPQPGHYLFESKVSMWTWFRALQRGRQTPYRLVLGKQRTPQRLAAFLARNLQADSSAWMTLFHDSLVMDGRPRDPQNTILYFLSDTYEVYWTVRPKQFLQRMQEEHRKFWTPTRISEAKNQGLTPREAMILASLVEEETQYAPERPRIAGVYLRRLGLGMPLQADPSVKFALGRFDLRRIGTEQTRYQSPYNTYLNGGLPPGPLCIPSKNAIEAVLKAEKHDFLYFCANPNRVGTHLFATRYDEHLRNAQRYRKSLDNRGVKIQS